MKRIRSNIYTLESDEEGVVEQIVKIVVGIKEWGDSKVCLRLSNRAIWIILLRDDDDVDDEIEVCSTFYPLKLNSISCIWSFFNR